MGRPLDVTTTNTLLSSGVGALGSLGATFLNGALNRDSMDRQVQASKDLMKYEWDNFKSPRAQVGALAAAGINPAVAFGNNSGTVATPSPSMPQSVPPAFNFNSISDFISAMATAKKAGLESEAQNLQNEITYRQFDSLVHKVALENSWTEGQIVKTSHEINKILGEIAINANINELEKKKVDWFENHMKAEISNLKSSAEYQKAMAGLTDSNKKLLDDTMDDLKSITGYNKEYLQNLVKLLDKYGDAQAIIGMVSQVVSSASDFIGNFIPSKKIIETIKK